ncbi:MAG: sulfite oxidase SoxC [Rhodocyclales bacterium]|nr:sulfite oxidase SoxC [Rhodocyclales bacterium]
MDTRIPKPYGEAVAPAQTLDRRDFLKQGIKVAGTAVAGGIAGTAALSAQGAEPIGKDFPAWSNTMGKGLSTYGQPSRFEDPVKRYAASGYGTLAPGTGSARSPIEKLEGVITPNGLHYDRSHNGTPDIDPAKHKLLIHGLVKRPLTFSIAELSRYPMVSRICFLECAGNSSGNAVAAEPPQVSAGNVHGLISCADWTGVPLALLLNEAGVEPGGKWLLAEGADSAAMSRSIPIEKAFDDAIVALYQNGERIRPENGYPVRLLLPGWEGNMNVKWLNRIKVTDGPTHTKDETSKYSDPMADGKARQFTFEQGVKSVITRPSGTMTMSGAGLYEITGIAWSGAGRISRVEISLDGGATWRDALLTGQALPKSVVRFRLPWEWNGSPAQLQSRAIDEKGNVQPTRKMYKAENAVDGRFHNNSIVAWGVDADGSIKNVYS